MRTTYAVVAAVLLFGQAAMSGAAQAGKQENINFTLAEVSSMTAKVVEVNRQARTVTLEREDGKVQTVKVRDDVRNFNEVMKGDTVTMEVSETISVEVQPGPGETMNIGSESQTSSQPGAKPSSIRTIEGKLKTRVEAIDHNARTVTFKNRKGVLTTYKVGEQAKRFREIRRNDMLVVEYSQTVAVSVK